MTTCPADSAARPQVPPGRPTADRPRGPTGASARRRFIARVGTAVGGLLAVASARASFGDPPRRLGFVHLHTGEHIDAVYWEDGHYLPDALERIAWVLRDFRANEAHPMDLELLDTLSRLRSRLKAREPFHVISAYRSPKTNEMLRQRGSAVAANSLHLYGRAIDIRIPGVNLSALHTAALGLRAGGVGLYTRTEFVHVDNGRVRRW
jgi:uncharacterized protein YcbK (DUF882 family)